MTEGQAQVEIPTDIFQFNSAFAVWQWTFLFLCDNKLFWQDSCPKMNPTDMNR
jgi:hypothetical protein